MNCCKCDKDVDVRREAEANQHIPAKWFGLYRSEKLERLICAECIKKPENKGWWK
jgi:hypothetical protein